MNPRPRTSALNLAPALAALFAVVVLSADVAYGQWTQWGGQNGDFKVSGEGIAATWPEGGPRQLWKRDLGDGYSAILADQGRLYTMHRRDEKEIVIAMDAATGKTVWEYKYDITPGKGHEMQFGAGPRATPLLCGDRLYTVGMSGKMHCIDADSGKPVWSHDLWKDFGGNFLNHGYSSSPVQYGSTVIVPVGGEEASIVAFDKYDGHVVWKNQGFKNSYSTPILVNVDGQEQLITFMASEIAGVNPIDGDLLWRHAHSNQWGQNVCQPIWSAKHNILFFSTIETGSRGIRLTQENGKTEVKELWSTRKIQFYHVNAVAFGDIVYGSTGTQGPFFFASINMETGKIAWRKRGIGKATCIGVGQKLIILDEKGQLMLATPSSDGLHIDAEAQLFDAVSWTVPTIVGTKLYARDQKIIVALDLS